jgi:hypothetical protein
MDKRRSIIAKASFVAACRRLRTSAAMLVTVLTALTVTASPRQEGPTPANTGEIRTDDLVVQWLVTKGSRYSGTLGSLIESIKETDVIVYVKVDPTLPRRIGGKTSFLAAVPGCRYVLITLVPHDDVIATTAVLGHELAHVLEIASAPSIIDAKSMAEAYMPHVFGLRGGKPVADTARAQEVTRAIRRELNSRGAAMKGEFYPFMVGERLHLARR